MGEGFIIDDRNIKVNFIGKAQTTQVKFLSKQLYQLNLGLSHMRDLFPANYFLRAYDPLQGRVICCFFNYEYFQHIFCFQCACQTRETDQNCPRCHEPVQRIEKCPRGAVFVCRIPLCRRTYLSQR